MENISEVNNKENHVGYKKLLLIFSVTFIIIVALAILFYVNVNKDTSKEIKGSIKYVGADYIILTDNNTDDEYIIDRDDIVLDSDYGVGDELFLTIDKINTNKDPIEAEAKNVKIIAKAKEENKEDNNNNENTNNSEVVAKEESAESSSNDSVSNNVTASIPSDNTSNNKTDTNTVGSDEDVISYFNSVNSDIDRSNNNRSLSESAKNGFVSVVDFLFYDKPIKGRTYKELSTKAKLKVLKIAIGIDSKLDKFFPDYKGTLSSKYHNLKSQAISKYLDKTAEICSKNEDTCAEAKKGLTDLKNNFSITWNFIKDISGVGLSKLKSWYEIWRQT